MSGKRWQGWFCDLGATPNPKNTYSPLDRRYDKLHFHGQHPVPPSTARLAPASCCLEPHRISGSTSVTDEAKAAYLSVPSQALARPWGGARRESWEQRARLGHHFSH